MQTLKLLLSVLISSWQFFKETSVPSPRIEFSLLSMEQEAGDWQELCFRPKQRSLAAIFKSLFFNPHWNEALYVMDCAERLIVDPTEDMSQEIMRRVESELKRRKFDAVATPYLQFRLVFVSRQDEELHEDILFVSKVKKFCEAVE